MKIEDQIAEELAAALESDEVAPANPNFVSHHGTGAVGDLNSSSATTPMDLGMNGGAGTRPMPDGFLTVDDTDHARHVAEAQAAHAMADASLRRFRNAPIVQPGAVAGLANMKGNDDD